MEAQSGQQGWSDIDRTGDAEFYRDYLDQITRLDFAQEYKRRSYDLAHIRSGDRVLDVGCGTGDDGLAVAELVGPTGRVFGIDSSEEMIAVARKRAADSRLPVNFSVDTVYDLPFEANQFDSCRADRILQHLHYPEDALAEIYRVVRPGGYIVLSDPDYETVVVDSPHRALTRKFLQFVTDHITVNGWSGRRLYRYCKSLGLRDVQTASVAFYLKDFAAARKLFVWQENLQKAQDAGVLSQEDTHEWTQTLKDMDAEGKFCVSVTCFIASGQKPQ